MKFLLDTNACVHLLRDRAEGALIRRAILSHPAGSVHVCPIARAELVYGALRSKAPQAAAAQVEQLLTLFPTLPFDVESANHAGRHRAALASLGTPIGAHDLLIAGIATAHAATLITHNIKEFSRVPGLALEDWQGAQ